MGLRSVFARAARTAFKVAGDIPRTCTYRQDRSDSLERRDPVEFPVLALFGRVNWRTINTSDDVLPGDSTITIRADEMRVAPERGDTVTTPDGTVYRVVDFAAGMGDILISLHVRRL